MGYGTIGDRLATFHSSWTCDLSATSIAHEGFYFAGPPDTVRCSRCSHEFSRLTTVETLKRRHRSESPHCSFVTGRNENVAEPLTSAHAHEEPRGNGNRESQPRGEQHQGGGSPDRTPPVGATNSSTISNGRVPPERPAAQRPSSQEVLQQIEGSLTPFYTQYNTFEQRMQSYNDPEHPWPSACPTNPGDLAAAGLFYTGIADKVQCAYCRGKLYNWGLRDSPLYQHCINFSRCGFVQKIKELKLDSNLETSTSTYTSSEYGTFSKLPAFHGLVSRGYRPEDLSRAITYLLKTVKLSLADMQEDILQDAVHQLGATEMREQGARGGDPGVATNSEPNLTDDRRNSPTDDRSRPNDIVLPSGRTGDDDENTHHPVEGATGSGNITELPESTRRTSAATGQDPRTQRLREKVDELQRENEHLLGTQLCRVCKKMEANVLFLPCRHLVTCESCSEKLEKDARDFCPLCNARVLGSVKTYKA